MTIQNRSTKLSSVYPAVMFPVRLETRYSSDGDHIKIRVIPDICHLDSHRPQLNPLEEQLGREYWTRRAEAVAKNQPIDSLFSDLSSRVGATRAAWVATTTRPINWKNSKPPKPLTWPELRVDERSKPVQASLLPAFWYAAAFVGNQIRSTAVSRDITDDVIVAPDFGISLDPDGGVEDFLKQQKLGWLVDFDEAFDLGMGLKLPVTAPMADGVDELIVVGVPLDEKPKDRASRLEDQLTSCRYTHGLELLRRGSPTNITESTETSADGDEASAPDLALGLATSASYEPELSLPTDTKGRNAAHLVRAFGLGEQSVLNRPLHAADRQLDIASNMRQITWPALEGHLLSSMLDEVTDDDFRKVMRTFALRYHRPGGHMPALQIGPQPYGVHLVSHTERGRNDGTRPGKVEAVWHDAHFDWDTDTVPRMEPLAVFDPSAAPIDLDDYLAGVAAIVASEPNPAELFLRTAEDNKLSLLAQWLFLILLLDLGLSNFPLAEEQFINDDPQDIHELQDALDALRPHLSGSGLTSEQQTAGEALLELLEGIDRAVQERVDLIKPLEDIGLHGATGLFGASSNPRAMDLLFEEELRAWNAPIVAPQDTDAETLAEWCEELADNAGGSPPASPVSPEPLFWRVASDACRRVSPDNADDLAKALRALASHVRTAPDTAFEDVELTLLESIGGASTRIDAWKTAAAHARLPGLRRKVDGPLTPHISGWGVVTDLRQGTGRRTDGFIPTPTITHAATAAVLRSGWTAIGDAGHTAPLSVDLSSDRAQRAIWLSGGIRAGAPLGDLLGARLERRLSESGETEAIETIRTVFAKDRDTTAIPVIDGVSVARAWGEGIADRTSLEIELHAELNDLVATSPGVSEALNEALTDLDSVGDISIAQSVHSLVQGEHEAARASLEAVTTGAVNPPAPTVLHSKPGFTLVDHLVTLTVPSKAVWTATNSPRAMADPAADRLAAHLIAEPKNVELLVIPADEDASITSIPLDAAARLGVSALDLVMDLTASGGITGITRERLVREADETVLSDDTGTVTRIGDAHSAVAASWHQLGVILGDGRSATTADLTPPGMRDPDDPHAATPDDDANWLEELEIRLADIDLLEDELVPPATGLPRTTIDECEAELRARLGKLPLLREISNPTWLANQLEDHPDGIADTADVLDWIATTGVIRRPLRRLCDLVDADEARREVAWTATAAQTGDDATWAATHTPQGSGSSTITFVGPTNEDPTEKMTMLVVDAWNDAAPQTAHSAAAAVHFDQPEAEAPNLILLATLPDTDVWDARSLAECVWHALDEARVRMVGADGIEGLGQYLPATFLASSTGSDQEKP